MLRLIDCHQHFWDLKNHYYPWLSDRIVPKNYGDYEPIRRSYSINDYLSDMGPLPVVKSIHVNAGYDRRHPVRETEWLQAIADDSSVSRGLPHGIVADADFLLPDVSETLEAHCRFANMRGIRQILSGIVTDPANYPDITKSPAWHRNASRLQHFGLSLDLQVHPRQVAMVCHLARTNPALQLIICHAGMPEGLTSGVLDEWRSGISQLATLPNIAIKISGLGMFDTAWTAASIRPIILDTIDRFGTERTMFGTNYPVDSLFSDFASIWRAYREITKDFSRIECERLFSGNAERIYRI